MSNTMSDLREVVSSRMRNALHGREIDMIESTKPRIPHMLGVTPLGNPHDVTNEDGTLLDPQSAFWQSYEPSVQTRRDVEQEIETAIRSLKKSGVFRMEYPYDEDAGIVYIEVDSMRQTNRTLLEGETECVNCGSKTTAQPTLVQTNNAYNISVSVECENCDFSGEFETPLVRK